MQPVAVSLVPDGGDVVDREPECDHFPTRVVPGCTTRFKRIIGPWFQAAL